MPVERGLIIGAHVLNHTIFSEGKIVPNTEWVQRDPAMWFQCFPSETKTTLGGIPQTKRREDVRLLVGHWTTAENPAATVVAGWKRRSQKEVASAHFIIDPAMPDEEYATVWQVSDPAATVTYHAPAFNASAIGVEIASCGKVTAHHDPSYAAATRSFPFLGLKGGGKGNRKKDAPTRATYLNFQPAQLRSWQRLALTLTDPDIQKIVNEFTDAQNIKRVADGKPISRAISIPRLIHVWDAVPTGQCRVMLGDWVFPSENEFIPRGEWEGIAEHINNYQDKTDAAGFLLESLLEMNPAGTTDVWKEKIEDLAKYRRIQPAEYAEAKRIREEKRAREALSGG